MPDKWQWMLAGCLSLIAVGLPALAQLDRIGGPVEFRSADQPIAAPTLRDPESVGLPSDSAKVLGPGPLASDDVLKRIDTDLGRTGMRSTGDVNTGRQESLYNAGEHLEKQSPGSRASR
jgi:hypothetical protein